MGYSLGKWAALLFTFSASAQALLLPPSPSSNLPAFKKQLIFYNSTRILNKLKEADPTVRHADGLVKLTKDVNASYSASPLFKTKLGAEIQKGIIYSELFIIAPTVINSIDTINNKYSLQIKYRNAKLYMDKPFTRGDYNLGVAIQLAIE